MQRRFLTFGFLGAVAFGVGGHALAQPPQPAANLKAQSRVTFENGRVTFKTFGDHAQASITREAGNVKEGVAALRFDYHVQNGEINALSASFDAGAAEEVISFRFWVKTDAETNMALVLQEKDGGRYAALFHTPKDTWQQVQISLSDFYLTDDKDDPRDPNNQLDMDRVDTLALADFNQLFAQGKDAALAKKFGVTLGAHTLFVDDFWASDQALPAVVPPVGVTLKDGKDVGAIDTFARPQVNWAVLGNVQVARVTEADFAQQNVPSPVRARGAQATYTQRAGEVVGLVRRVPKGKLKDMDALKLTLASRKPSTIAVQLEETSGGKYYATVPTSGRGVPAEVRLIPALFGRADDSKDDNGRLDLDQVKQIVILDASGLIGPGDGDTVLWVSDVRVEKR